MTQPVIRVADPADYARIGEITADAYLGDGLISPTSSYLAELRDAADRAARAQLLVSEVGGQLAGTVTYCPHGSPYAEVTEPGEAEFRMLAVTHAARGRGVGEALVRACVERAEQAGLSAVRLSTQHTMRAAHRIYQRLGFVRTPERDWSPLPEVELITFALKL